MDQNLWILSGITLGAYRHFASTSVPIGEEPKQSEDANARDIKPRFAGVHLECAGACTVVISNNGLG